MNISAETLHVVAIQSLNCPARQRPLCGNICGQTPPYLHSQRLFLPFFRDTFPTPSPFLSYTIGQFAFVIAEGGENPTCGRKGWERSSFPCWGWGFFLASGYVYNIKLKKL